MYAVDPSVSNLFIVVVAESDDVNRALKLELELGLPEDAWREVLIVCRGEHADPQVVSLEEFTRAREGTEHLTNIDLVEYSHMNVPSIQFGLYDYLMEDGTITPHRHPDQ
ncbi:hypothetical protein HOI18_00645 [Candidatus Uhrbacteria bacterium]|jgi:hypothetical protein|nr:hypothetical protein [Candidatus Uhrbacteria bacterium]